MLSLICSCFYSQPHPNTIYQYGGECARAPTCGFQNPLVHLAWGEGPVQGLRPWFGCVLGPGPSTCSFLGWPS